MIDEDKIEETIQNRLISLSLLTTVLTRAKYLGGDFLIILYIFIHV